MNGVKLRIFNVSERSYREVFVTKFNLGFGSPRPDTCSTCDLGGNNEKHKLRADKAFENQRHDRELGAFRAIARKRQF